MHRRGTENVGNDLLKLTVEDVLFIFSKLLRMTACLKMPTVCFLTTLDSGNKRKGTLINFRAFS